MDGAVLDGEAPGTWAKYAIPKGLPTEEGERRMAIENQAHSVEEKSFVIQEGLRGCLRRPEQRRVQ